MDVKRKGNLEDPLALEDLRYSIKKLNPDITFSDADHDLNAVSLRAITAKLEGIKIIIDIINKTIVITSYIRTTKKKSSDYSTLKT